MTELPALEEIDKHLDTITSYYWKMYCYNLFSLEDQVWSFLMVRSRLTFGSAGPEKFRDFFINFAKTYCPDIGCWTISAYWSYQNKDDADMVLLLKQMIEEWKAVK